MTFDSTTTVETRYQREVTVNVNSSGTYLKVANTTSRRYEQAFLSPDNAKELGTALLEAAGETIHNELGELPAVKDDPYHVGYLACGGVSRRTNANPKAVLQLAKEYFALYKELQKLADAKAEEAKKAEAVKAEAEDKLWKRRNELTRELTGNPETSYIYASELSRKAIDKIIELEPKAYEAYWV